MHNTAGVDVAVLIVGACLIAIVVFISCQCATSQPEEKTEFEKDQEKNPVLADIKYGTFWSEGNRFIKDPEL
jgi:hypothetical protein